MTEEKVIPIQVISDEMLAMMKKQEIKDAGFSIKLTLINGIVYKGVYLDITLHPLNDKLFSDTDCLVFMTNKPTPETKVWLPLRLISTIEWVG